MATNITGVTFTQPSSDPGISPEGNFVMGGQIQTSGGGGWAESGDMYFEWDQGTSTWATIGGSGALFTEDTNPITGLQTADEQTITVYNDGTTGSFQIRVKLIEDDLTEYTTTPVDVVIASDDVNVEPGVIGLSLNTYQANVDAEIEVEAGVSALSLAIYQANVDAEIDVDVDVSALSLATHKADVDAEIDVDVGIVNLNLVTYQAGVDDGLGINVEAGVLGLVLNTHKANVDAEIDVGVNLVNLLLATYQADITADIEVLAGVGVLNLATYAANIGVDAGIYRNPKLKKIKILKIIFRNEGYGFINSL